MALDHFKLYGWNLRRTNWNFDIVFDDQPQVIELALKYAPLLRHSGLHKPVPGKWLHATILRVGFVEEFTDLEMLTVADKLEPKLKVVSMPKFMLGQWWLWMGSPVLHLTPDTPFQEIFNKVAESLVEVVGEKRLPRELNFIPHVTLAYARSYSNELSLYHRLESNPIAGIEVEITKLSLMKQHVEDDHYAWEIVRELPIGMAL